MTEAQLCAVFGWKMGSKMPRRYIHFSLRDVDDAILKAHGLKKAEVAVVEAPKRCPRCGAASQAGAVSCFRCGMAFTLEAAMKKDQELEEMKARQERLEKVMDMLLKHPELAEKLRETGHAGGEQDR